MLSTWVQPQTFGGYVRAGRSLKPVPRLKDNAYSLVPRITIYLNRKLNYSLACHKESSCLFETMTNLVLSLIVEAFVYSG